MKEYSKTTMKAIEATGYTAEEMIKLAIMCAAQRCGEWQKQAKENGDFTAYQHYERLLNAFEFLKDEQ